MTAVYKVLKITEQNRMGGRRGEGQLFNEYRVSVFQDENVLEDLFHNNVNTLNTTELYTQKWL